MHVSAASVRRGHGAKIPSFLPNRVARMHGPNFYSVSVYVVPLDRSASMHIYAGRDTYARTARLPRDATLLLLLFNIITIKLVVSCVRDDHKLKVPGC